MNLKNDLQVILTRKTKGLIKQIVKKEESEIFSAIYGKLVI